MTALLEDIITGWALFTQLVARNSTFACKGKAIDIRLAGVAPGRFTPAMRTGCEGGSLMFTED